MCLALLFASHFAVAGTVTAKVDTLLAGPDYGTRLFVGIAGVLSKPACSTNSNFSFVIDTAAPGAKVWVAMLHIAYATGKSVYVQGANTCALWSNTEDVQYLWLQ